MSVHMMVSMDVLSKYNENNSYARNQLLKVKTLITPGLIDQIPILYELKNYLERLSMINSQTGSNFSSVMVVSQSRLHDQLRREVGKWTFDRERIKLDLECPEFKKLIDKLMEMYMDQMDLGQKVLLKKKLDKQKKKAETEQTTCAKCGKEAGKRCSECKKYYYCSKKCQKKDLKSNHKNECKLHSEYVQKCVELLRKKKRQKQSKLKKEKEKTKAPTNEKKPNQDSQTKVFSEMKNAILLGRANVKNVFEKLNKIKKNTKPTNKDKSTQIEVGVANEMDELD